MPDYDYSVLYQPMLEQFRYYTDVMLSSLSVWLPILLPITGAIVLIEISLLIFKGVVNQATLDVESISSHFYTSDYEDMFLDEYDVEMYGSFIESMEDIEERLYEKYLNDDYSDFESFMPEDEEEHLIHFDSSDFVELPDYDPDYFIDYDEGDY